MECTECVRSIDSWLPLLCLLTQLSVLALQFLLCAMCRLAMSGLPPPDLP